MQTTLFFISALFISSLFSVPGLSAQDTTYYSKKNEVITSLKKADRYDVETIINGDSSFINRKSYNKSGRIHREENFKTHPETILEGANRIWYETVQLKMETNYENGVIHGELLSYWKDGTKKRHDIFEKGVLKEGHCYNEKGEEVAHYPYFIMPEYPGGESALYEFLKANTVYPSNAKNAGIQGIVKVRFVVDTKGKITDITVIDSVHKDLDKSAINTIKKMPNWNPGKIDGDLHKIQYNLPFSFKLRS